MHNRLETQSAGD